ncbi:MAG TPA: flagellar hook assembly protein FlgD [Noviherbaspirillum sp.]
MTSVQKVSPELMAAVNGPAKGGVGQVEDAQNRFMTLLVTQMRNQDPLNPLDNAQVTSQLAQLSTVSGIEKLNTTLESLQSSYFASQSMQAANMIGRGVLVPGNDLQLVEGKSIFGVELEEPADALRITVRDKDGVAVHQMDLGAAEAGVVPLAWDGKLDKDKQAPDGNYTFEVVAERAGEKTKANTLAFGVVSSVSTSGQGVKLNVPGLGALGMTDVREIL